MRDPALRVASWIASTAVLSLLVLTAVVGCASSQPAAVVLMPGAEDLELAELVLKESSGSFGNSTEGTVIARFADFEASNPLGVWTYEKGALHAVGTQRLDEAFGDKRSKWPNYTLLFAAASEKEGRLLLQVKTWYDMGLFPDSRGGNAEAWTLERRDGRWVVIDKETTLHWD
ncbi:MAG TPA: hypothetical protein VMW27_13260 [Thermoanaerobaculia bacterium]|nr:hypothetical protein [Thermoanaerobaculia bacterium]